MKEIYCFLHIYIKIPSNLLNYFALIFLLDNKKILNIIKVAHNLLFTNRKEDYYGREKGNYGMGV